MHNLPENHEDYDVIVNLLKTKHLNESYLLIVEMFKKYPDDPWAHNLLGCWNEIRGDAILAMKHYRAAYALSPAYDASRMNIIEFQMHTRPINHIYF